MPIRISTIFTEGPKRTGIRYRMNSDALRFIPKENYKKEGCGEDWKRLPKKYFTFLIQVKHTLIFLYYSFVKIAGRYVQGISELAIETNPFKGGKK